jgi:serine protease
VAGRPVSVSVLATDRLAHPALRYTASGLPAGLAIDRVTGLIGGRPGLPGSAPGAHGGRNGGDLDAAHEVTVTVRDRGGRAASTRFRLTVTRAGEPGCTGIEQAVDPGSEVPTDAKGAYPGWWTQSAPGVITRSTEHTAHSGHGYAWLGHSAGADDALSQGIETTPGYTHASFSFWLHVSPANASVDPGHADTLTLELDDQYSGRRDASTAFLVDDTSFRLN